MNKRKKEIWKKVRHSSSVAVSPNYNTTAALRPVSLAPRGEDGGGFATDSGAVGEGRGDLEKLVCLIKNEFTGIAAKALLSRQSPLLTAVSPRYALGRGKLARRGLNHDRVTQTL